LAKFSTDKYFIFNGQIFWTFSENIFVHGISTGIFACRNLIGSWFPVFWLADFVLTVSHELSTLWRQIRYRWKALDLENSSSSFSLPETLFQITLPQTN